MLAPESSPTPSSFLFFFQAEDGIRDLVRSRGLGDVYKRQKHCRDGSLLGEGWERNTASLEVVNLDALLNRLDSSPCLLYTSDAADERSSVDLGGRRIIKKKTKDDISISDDRDHNNSR